MGGMVAAVERGFPQREIQESAFRFQQAVERKEKVIVGVNEYVMEEKPHPILYIDEQVAEEQVARVQALRAQPGRRRASTRALEDLKAAARGTDNLMPADPRGLAGLRHGRRDVRRPARGLRRVPGTADLLADRSPSRSAGRRMSGRPRRCGYDSAMTETAARRIQGRHREAGARRPRPRGQGDRSRAARRGHGGHLHGPAPEPRADRGRRRAGGRRRDRPQHPLRGPPAHLPARRGAAARARDGLASACSWAGSSRARTSRSSSSSASPTCSCPGRRPRTSSGSSRQGAAARA